MKPDPSLNTTSSTNYIQGTQPEKWKNIIFPEPYKTDQQYQVSNYGRVRNNYGPDVYRIKKPILYKGSLLFRFGFPKSRNNGVRLQLHMHVKNLVAQHFCKDYVNGCFVVWSDYNRLNNFYKNLLCLEPSKGRSHAARGRYIKGKKQIPVLPPLEEKIYKSAPDKSPHKVEPDYDFFKPIPEFSAYEINRYGMVIKARPPYAGRLIKQRLHPDKFYFMDLRDNSNKKRTVYTHKAVASAWNINVLPERRKIVIHKDGDTTNNHSDNLEWVDHSEALKHQFATKQRDNHKSWKTRKKRYGKSGQKKFTKKAESQ